jgi:hypothetical protein
MRSTDPPDPSTDVVAARGRRAAWTILGILGAFALVGLGLTGLIVGYHAASDRPLPAFPRLTDRPDPTIGGTVAYYAAASGCVRLVAAAGSPAVDLWCLPAEGPDVWRTEGKPVGPQLVWRPDGRLEVTMFRMRPDGSTKTAPPLTAGWQRIVDPRTGEVESVPADQVPSTPRTSAGPRTSPDGTTIRVRRDAQTGAVAVTLTGRGPARHLLSVQGPGEYGYAFGPVFWAPTWTWIAAADDGRILVITPAGPTRVRVLVTGAGGGAGGGEAGPAFAVTAEDLRAPGR